MRCAGLARASSLPYSVGDVPHHERLPGWHTSDVQRRQHLHRRWPTRTRTSACSSSTRATTRPACCWRTAQAGVQPDHVPAEGVRRGVTRPSPSGCASLLRRSRGVAGRKDSSATGTTRRPSGGCTSAARCSTLLERPWLNNRAGVSCIPAGTYIVGPRRFLRGGYDAIEVREVPGRTHFCSTSTASSMTARVYPRREQSVAVGRFAVDQGEREGIR